MPNPDSLTSSRSRRAPVWLLAFLFGFLLTILLLLRERSEDDEAQSVTRYTAEIPLGEPQASVADFPPPLSATSPAPSADRPTDDLKAINGIGPVFERLLHQAGIRTFAQLSAASPDELRSLLEARDYTLANPESWIEQARQLAGKRA
ncbi:MAG TPA: DUF4332 domain-containing protein [Chloroflexi bacterium]|nr:DUF4332 domain-containing protein [Chloroflexota bacterium]